MSRLKGKVAVVTGGTSGIGRGIVLRFVEEGAHVVFSGRRVAEGRDIANGCGAVFVQADVTREEEAVGTIRFAEEKHGRLDILVNNAGAPHPAGRIQDIKLDDFNHAFRLHVMGALAHIKAAAPGMRERRCGSIVNISSIGAHRPGYSSSVAYSVAKAALLHLTSWVALELGEDNVRCNSICPGTIATGIFAKIGGRMSGREADETAEKIKTAIAAMQPIPRAGLPDDIASAAVFLAGDESTFVNGADFVVDGGMMTGRRYSENNASASHWKAMFE